MIFHVVQECRRRFLLFCHNSRVWQTDGQTDISLMAKTVLHRCSTVITLWQFSEISYDRKLHAVGTEWLCMQVCPKMYDRLYAYANGIALSARVVYEVQWENKMSRKCRTQCCVSIERQNKLAYF